ncbi:hypothetical protein CLOM_g22596 [Closterium sp. NIES-68]|nr:hypothetical protein CLOM_g22596 [Closterium sp. NIES-68]
MIRGKKVFGGGKTIGGDGVNLRMVKWKDVTPVEGLQILMDHRNPAAGGFMGLEEIDPAEFEGLAEGGLKGGEEGKVSGRSGVRQDEGKGKGKMSRILEAAKDAGEGKGKLSKSQRRKMQRKLLKTALKRGEKAGRNNVPGERREGGKKEGEEEGQEGEDEGEDEGEEEEEGEEGECEEGEAGEGDGEAAEGEDDEGGEGEAGEGEGEERVGEEGEGEEDILMPDWEMLRLNPLILRALKDLGFTSPTPIQRACIPAAAMRGRDVVGAAETGSGKTLAFAIPILQRLLDEREKERRQAEEGGAWGGEGEEGEEEGSHGERGGEEVGAEEGGKGAGADSGGEQSGEGKEEAEGEGEGVMKGGGKAEGAGARKKVKGPLRALIITPTRELALQIVSHIKDAARHTGIHVAGIVGGMAEVKQKRVLSHGPQIVVGTPGRLWELMSQGEEHLVKLDYLSFLVLDEADRMADPGRFKELSSILGMLPPTAASLAAAKAKEAALAARDAARAAKKAARAVKLAKERDAARGKGGKGKEGREKVGRKGKGGEEEEGEEKEEKEGEEEKGEERGGEEGEEGGDKEDGEEEEVGEGEEVFPSQPPTLAKKKRQVLVFSATLVLPDDTRGQLQGKKRAPGAAGAAGRHAGKRGREAAEGEGGGEEDEGDKEREKGLERDRVVASLMELTGMRPSPAIVDLTTADVVASGVQEAALECDDSMRDVFLLYLLRMHGTFGRTLVFCSAISSVRRLASLLALLQVPSFPLHAQQQQRQRLKALDRFRQHPSGVLVATDVAARGLDVPEVRLVVHYQLPHTAEGYVHRCGRTARGAASEGCSVALVTPKDSIKYSSLLRKLNKSGPLPTFPVDHNYLPNLKQCVSLALSVDTLSRKHSKEKAETSWKQRAAKAVQVNLEEGGADVAGGEEEEEEEDEEGAEEESEEEYFDDFDEAGGESDDEGERGGRGKGNKKRQQEERRSKRRRGGARGEEGGEGEADRGVDVRRLVGRGEKRGWEGPGETGEDGRQQMKQEVMELQRMKETLKQAVSQPLRPTNLRSLIAASGMTTELANQLRANPASVATSAAATTPANSRVLPNPYLSMATARAGKQWVAGGMQGGERGGRGGGRGGWNGGGRGGRGRGGSVGGVGGRGGRGRGRGGGRGRGSGGGGPAGGGATGRGAGGGAGRMAGVVGSRQADAVTALKRAGGGKSARK